MTLNTVRCLRYVLQYATLHELLSKVGPCQTEICLKSCHRQEVHANKMQRENGLMLFIPRNDNSTITKANQMRNLPLTIMLRENDYVLM